MPGPPRLTFSQLSRLTDMLKVMSGLNPVVVDGIAVLNDIGETWNRTAGSQPIDGRPDMLFVLELYRSAAAWLVVGKKLLDDAPAVQRFLNSPELGVTPEEAASYVQDLFAKIADDEYRRQNKASPPK